MLPYWAVGPFTGNHLFRLDDDPAETRNLAGDKQERSARDRLRTALEEVGAPSEQFQRLGLS